MSDCDWDSLPDEQLLGVRMGDLDLTMGGPPVWASPLQKPDSPPMPMVTAGWSLPR